MNKTLSGSGSNQTGLLEIHFYVPWMTWSPGALKPFIELVGMRKS